MESANPISYPGSGTTWYDLIGSRDITLNNGVTFNSSGAKYFSFDGVDDYASFSYPEMIHLFNTGGTFSFWIKTTTTAIGHLFGTLNLDFNTAFWFETNNNAGTPQAGYTMLSIRGERISNTPTNRYVINEDIYDGSWKHIVITSEGVESDAITIYVNGVSVSITTAHQNPSTPITFSDFQYDVYLGARNNRGSINEPYLGDIGEFIIYDKVLTPSEVLQNYNVTKTNYGL